MTKFLKKTARQKIKIKVRSVVIGTSKRPRLSVFRSNKYIYAQIINDEKGETVASFSDAKIKEKKKKIDKATVVGETIADLGLKAGVKEVSFDRNGFRYHGRIKSLADGARKKGLVF